VFHALGVSLLNMDVNVKQRPQLTRMACRRADFSRPWRVETLPYAGHACFMLLGVLVEHERLSIWERTNLSFKVNVNVNVKEST